MKLTDSCDVSGKSDNNSSSDRSDSSDSSDSSDITYSGDHCHGKKEALAKLPVGRIEVSLQWGDTPGGRGQIREDSEYLGQI